MDGEAIGQEEAEEGEEGLGKKVIRLESQQHHHCSGLCLQLTEGGRSNIRWWRRNHLCDIFGFMRSTLIYLALLMAPVSVFKETNLVNYDE